MSDTDDAPALFHPAPHGLHRAGLALWFSIAEKYQLRPDEQARLAGACKIADVIARLESAWESAGFPMTTLGSMGQQVIHPLIGELRTQRAALDGMLARLKLPELDGEGAAPVPNQQRGAAQSRWAVPGRGA